jgi:hypothetical protein
VDEDGGEVDRRTWEGKAADCVMLLSSNHEFHDFVVCIRAGVSNNEWPVTFEVPLLGVLFTDVGRKLRQERFASALLVL